MLKFKMPWISLSGVLLIAGGAVGLLILGLSVSPNILQAAPTATWHVDAASGDDGNDCLSLATACETIAAAVDKAANDDTIQINSGLYLEHDIEVFKRLLLQGAGAGDTIIDGDHAGRVFKVSAESTIAGVTIRHGQILTPSANIFDIGGGAIQSLGKLTIQDSILVSNTVLGSGGAIFNNGELIIENTEILSNTSEANGGAIYNYTLGGITMTNSVMAGNTTIGLYGGAIYTVQPLYMKDVTVRDNSGPSFGGGLVSTEQAVLENVTLHGNEAAAGAALFASSGTVTLTNVTASDNTASNNYGGIYVSGPSTSLYLQNSTIANNHRTNAVGTGFNGLIIGNNASVNIINTVFAHNDDKNCGGTAGNWTSEGYNLSSDSSCAFTQTGDQQGVDPLLGPLADNGGPTLTHALQPGSPAIDTGTNAACPATDQRGIARPYDGDNNGVATCDKGAYEARHQITIQDATVNEGDISPVSAVFTVTLSPESDQVVTVDYATADGTALAGSDYSAISDTLTFDPGQTTKHITVTVTGDTDDEADETFKVLLSEAVNADILGSQATGTIVDNDGLPSLTIADQTVMEGNSGTVEALFMVTLSPVSSDTVTVNYDTTDGSAVAGEDFVAVSDSLTFDPGETTQQIAVEVNGDIFDEGTSETFTVNLSNPQQAKIVDGEAEGTITDDDTARLSHEAGPQVLEGDSGTSPAVFTVTLSTPAAFIVTVDYELSSGFGDTGAKAGEDFVDSSDTLVFQPGETIQTYTVDIIGDTEPEEDEIFSSLIKNANVPITVNGSLGHILNDDGFKLYLPAVLK